jgi:hypothetical protein
MPVIPALRTLTQNDCKFEASLGYTVRFCHEGGNWSSLAAHSVPVLKVLVYHMLLADTLLL